MSGKGGYRAQVLRSARLVVAVLVIAVPRLCLAQEGRTNDPPDPQQPTPTTPATGTTGTAPATGTTGTTPTTGTTGTAAPQAIGATSPTPIGGLFTEPRIISRAIQFA